MCSHHLVNPIACTRAAGWEKGQVENLVKESRVYSFKPRVEVADFDELNARLKKDALKRAKELRHPENPEMTVWDADLLLIPIDLMSRKIVVVASGAVRNREQREHGVT